MDWANVECCRIDVGMGTGTGVGAGAQDRVKGWWGRGTQGRRGKEEEPASRVGSGPKVWARGVVSALWVKITAGQGESGCTLASNAARQGKLGVSSGPTRDGEVSQQGNKHIGHFTSSRLHEGVDVKAG